MKNLLFFVIGIFVFTSCMEDKSLTEPKALVVSVPNNVVVLKQGAFQALAGKNVSGSARAIQIGEKKYIELKDFTISSGPDLKVYLSTSTGTTSIVNLGNLRSNSTSSESYEIPSVVDLNLYSYVLIHCQAFNYSFARANIL